MDKNPGDLYAVSEIGHDSEIEVPCEDTVAAVSADEVIPEDPAAAVKETFKLIQSGLAADAALRQTGASTLPANQVGILVTRLLADWSGLDPTQLKKLVEAGFTKLALASPDEKVQLKALENIAGMPGVGLSPSYAKVQNNFQFNLAPETKTLVDSLDDEAKP